MKSVLRKCLCLCSVSTGIQTESQKGHAYELQGLFRVSALYSAMGGSASGSVLWVNEIVLAFILKLKLKQKLLVVLAFSASSANHGFLRLRRSGSAGLCRRI